MKTLLKTALFLQLFTISSLAGAYDVRPTAVFLYNSSTGQSYYFGPSQLPVSYTTDHQDCDSTNAQVNNHWIDRCKKAAISTFSTDINWAIINSDLIGCRCWDGLNEVDCDTCNDGVSLGLPEIAWTAYDHAAYYIQGRSYAARIEAISDSCPYLYKRIGTYPYYIFLPKPNFYSTVRFDYG